MTDTVLSEWQAYLREVVPVNASEIQREECRRAFYAGMVAMRRLIFEATEADDDAEIEATLQRINEELNVFPRDLRMT